MTPTQAYKNFIIFIIATYAAKLVFGRLSVLSVAYSEERQEYNMFVAKHAKCLADDLAFHTFPRECRVAERESTRWPSGRAVGKAWDQTHSCIDYPCTDLVRGLMETWTALAVVCTVAGVGVFIVTLEICRRRETGQPMYQHHAPLSVAYPAMAPNDPAMMMGYNSIPLDMGAMGLMMRKRLV